MTQHNYIGKDKTAGELIIPNAIAMVIDPTLPSNIGMAASHWLNAQPLVVFTAWGATKNYLMVAVEGFYFWTAFPRSETLQKFCEDMKECKLTLDDENRFRALGFSSEIYNYQDLDGFSLYKPRYLPETGDRMIIIDTDKKIITENQYEIRGDFTEAFDLTWTDNPREIMAKAKPEADLMTFFFEPSKF